jgi:hypothetical protein
VTGAELPRDAEGFDVLPCGCRMKTAVVGGRDTFLFKPHALDCEHYLFVIAETERQGKQRNVIDTRPPGRRRG